MLHFTLSGSYQENDFGFLMKSLFLGYASAAQPLKPSIFPFYCTYFLNVLYMPLFEIWQRNHMPAKPNAGAKIQTAVSEKEIGTIERKTTTSILYVYYSSN